MAGPSRQMKEVTVTPTYVNTLEQREQQASADLAGLTAPVYHPKPTRCYRCAARVYTYATSADGQRHYCPCIRAVQVEYDETALTTARRQKKARGRKP